VSASLFTQVSVFAHLDQIASPEFSNQNGPCSISKSLCFRLKLSVLKLKCIILNHHSLVLSTASKLCKGFSLCDSVHRGLCHIFLVKCCEFSQFLCCCYMTNAGGTKSLENKKDT